MRDHALAPLAHLEVESSALSVLLNANTLRQGAEQLLDALHPLFDDDCAIALVWLDRDGVTLHVLAEHGPRARWPERLPPQLAAGETAAVEAGTGTYLVALRAEGRVVGSLLVGDTDTGAALATSDEFLATRDTVAAVLHHLAARTDAELQRRAERSRSIEAIVEGTTHQMANPLTGASAMAQMLADDLSDEDDRAAVRHIVAELKRGFVVLQDMLEFHRDTRAPDGVLDLNTIVERVLRFRGYAIREQGITLELHTSDAFLGVRADLHALEQALLVALRHAELRSQGTANRRIDVIVKEHGARDVCVTIADSGHGAVPDLSPRFLDLPFDGVAEGRDAAERPDLGLVASILRRCGGMLEHGLDERRATLTLVLPRATAPRGRRPAP